MAKTAGAWHLWGAVLSTTMHQSGTRAQAHCPETGCPLACKKVSVGCSNPGLVERRNRRDPASDLHPRCARRNGRCAGARRGLSRSALPIGYEYPYRTTVSVQRIDDSRGRPKMLIHPWDAASNAAALCTGLQAAPRHRAVVGKGNAPNDRCSPARCRVRSAPGMAPIVA